MDARDRARQAVAGEARVSALSADDALDVKFLWKAGEKASMRRDGSPTPEYSP
jgi:hypothetical protein